MISFENISIILGIVVAFGGIYKYITSPLLKLNTLLAQVTIQITNLVEKTKELDLNIKDSQLKNTSDHRFLHTKIDYNSNRISKIENELSLETPQPPTR